MRKRDSAQILWDNEYIDFKDININGNDSTVKLVEDKKYIAGKQSNGISESQTPYTVKLVKTGDKWLVTGIASEDEFDKAYQDKGLTAEQMLAEYDKPAKVETIGSKGKVNAALFGYSYNGSRASSYSYTYALSYNSLFKSYAPNDCQNFASQCTWYGFGGSNSSTAINNKYPPMVAGSANPWEQWWQNGPSGSTDSYNNSYWNWVNVVDFRDSVVDGTKSYGLFGSSTQGSVANAEVGDKIQIYSSSQGWYHTYVVYSVNGTYGSRTPSNIWVCAHTTDRRNVQLSTLGLSVSNMRLVKTTWVQGP